MPHPDALPNHERAVIPEAKLSGYALNAAHDVGGHKARLFAAILGITEQNWYVLAEAIRAGIARAPALHRGRNLHGDLYQVDVAVTGPAGSATVRTGWIIREPGAPPALTTAIVLKGTR